MDVMLLNFNYEQKKNYNHIFELNIKLGVRHFKSIFFMRSNLVSISSAVETIIEALLIIKVKWF